MKNERREIARLEAFSDGVFAIAIMLLVLELKVPSLSSNASPWDLARALGERWPSYLAFCGSFGSILIMWMNHHGIFRLVQKADAPFALANGFLLLMIVVVPYPTALVAEYLEKPAASTAVVAYSATYVLINIAYNALWFAASYKKRMLKPDVDLAHIRLTNLSFLSGLPIYFLALVISFWFPRVGMAICSSLWVLWAAMANRHFPN